MISFKKVLVKIGFISFFLSSFAFSQTNSTSNDDVFFIMGYGQWGVGENGYKEGLMEAETDAIALANRNCQPGQAIRVSPWKYGGVGTYGALTAGANFSCMTPSTQAASDLVQALQELTSSDCGSPVVSEDIYTYTCKAVGTNRTFAIKIDIAHKNPAMNGIRLDGAVDLSSSSSSEAIELFMYKVAQISFKYFLSFDRATTWNRQISQQSFIFNDPQALLAAFQNSGRIPSFVEMSYQSTLRIFIGFVG